MVTSSDTSGSSSTSSTDRHGFAASGSPRPMSVSAPRLPRVVVRKMIDDRGKFVRVDRFGEVQLITGGQGTMPIFAACQRRQRRRWRVTAVLGLDRPDPANQFQAVLPRHSQIADEHIGRCTSESIARLARGGGKRNRGALLFESRSKKIAGLSVIVDDEHGDAVQNR